MKEIDINEVDNITPVFGDDELKEIIEKKGSIAKNIRYLANIKYVCNEDKKK